MVSIPFLQVQRGEGKKKDDTYTVFLHHCADYAVLSSSNGQAGVTAFNVDFVLGFQAVTEQEQEGKNMDNKIHILSQDSNLGFLNRNFFSSLLMSM